MFGPKPDGATPVDADEAEDLIPAHVRTRAELNEWEQANILRAAEWVERSRTSGSFARRWARIPEAGGRYLRVVLLPDRETVRSAFFDRAFKP